MTHTPRTHKTTCCYCGVGCGIEVLRHADGRLELRGDAAHPANRGLLCSKGRSLLHTVNARAARLHYPALRTGRADPRERVSWDGAIGHIAGEFKRIIDRHGPDAVAFYISGQCLTEEYYLANKIAKGFLQTNNIDTNSRLCMSSAVSGYRATLGADGPPVSYDDIECADTFFIAGANPAWCHPILFRRIEARKAADPQRVRVVVADPRRTASAQVADLHLQLRPGTDVALFLGLARRLAQTGQLDDAFLAAHTEGADAFLQSADAWTLPRTAAVTGLKPYDIAQAADWLAGDRRFLSLWTMGLNQSAVGTDKNIALISLSLITGKIGKPGCGPFSLTGQPNAMGGREVGGMATLLPAHRELSNPEDRAQVARFWGVDQLPEKPGLTAVELFEGLAAGTVKAVWIIATNPVASMPAAWEVEKALARAELVIAQDIYPTETTALADVILPAAGWLEKTGTMTNSDRRISLLEKAVEPPGEALPDAEILQRFAHAMGWREAFSYTNVEAIFAEHVALTGGTDLDLGGLTHAYLRREGTIQWPVQRVSAFQTEGCTVPGDGSHHGAESRSDDTPPADRIRGTPRLYTDHRFRTPTGRARLRAVEYLDRSEPLNAEHPLRLTTGRIRDHWHTLTKTGQVNRLSAHIDSPFCEINPVDAAARRIREGDMVTLRNARGEVRVRAVVTGDILPGVVFLPMHWGKQLAGDRGRANNLTSPRLDPVSKEPDLKMAAVQVEAYIPPKRRIVIIGAGTAALAFIEAHRRTNARDEILLLGGESLPVYNRVLLPHYIEGGGGDTSWEPLVRADRASLTPHRVIFHPNTLVSRIDRSARTVQDSRGRLFQYDTLILATGSRPAIHYDGPVPEKGTFTLRSRRDADGILAAARANGGAPRQVVIHGGGLLGLELAAALRGLGCQVTILQRSDRLMGRQLDAIAAGHLAEELAHRGITVHFDTALVELVGDDRLEAVRIAKDPTRPGTPGATVPSRLPADLFIFATGTVPNKELAGAARGEGGSGGLDCARGILVNDFLQTSDPAIFAIGECAEHNGQTYGTTPAAEAQARALAEYLRGNEHAPYRGTTTANILKIPGLSLAAAGITDPSALAPIPGEAPVEVVTLHDPRTRYYQKCVVQNDRLIGAICLGDTVNFAQYLEWIASGLELDDLRGTLLRPGAGAARPVNGPLVCSCHHVGAGSIEAAAPACGHDLRQVCAATRAGMGCGSCKPEIMGILQRLLRQKEEGAAREPSLAGA